MFEYVPFRDIIIRFVFVKQSKKKTQYIHVVLHLYVNYYDNVVIDGFATPV